jgi:signal transduction histidine kinase
MVSFRAGVPEGSGPKPGVEEPLVSRSAASRDYLAGRSPFQNDPSANVGRGQQTTISLIPPSDLHLKFYSEIFKGLPLGVVILRLEDPKGADSFRIMDLNPAAAHMARSRPEDLGGKRLAEFPKLLETSFPGQCLDAVRAGKPRDLGRISWNDEQLGPTWVSVNVFPLSGDELGVVLQDVTYCRLAEQAAHQGAGAGVEQRADLLARVNQELRREIAECERVAEQYKITLQQLRSFAAGLQSVREDERARIAREIHDELGQACTAIKMDLAWIRRKATKRQAGLQSKAAAAIQVVDDMIVALRRIAVELRPRTLDDLGLAAAMEWQAQEFESRTGIRCCLTLPKEGIALDSERSTAVFRIFQESLTNVARHAQATRVDAGLETKAGQLIFQVHDNGKGFNLDEAWARRSLGLVGMRERAALLDGELKIQGVPGTGTTVILRIPLPSTLPLRQESK